MFQLHDVSLLAAAKPQERVLLGDVSAAFPTGQLTAVTGSPGAGKSLLLQLLAGVRQPTFGEVAWGGNEPRPAVAYRPGSGHLSRAEALLTPAEQVATALRLRVAGIGRHAAEAHGEALLEKVGLASVAQVRAAALSGAQRRRLALAVELAGNPALLLWDEHGEEVFDPQTEREFTQLLRRLAGELSMAVVRVTRALDRLEVYDSVLVLHGGHLAYHGSPGCLAHYFQIDAPEELLEALSLRRPEEWHRSWVKHREAYRPAAVPAHENGLPERRPGAFSQGITLFLRHWRVSWRDAGALGWQGALFLGFPFLAVLFVAGGLPRFLDLADQLKGDMAELLRANAVVAVDATHGVELVLGLTMAQLILLAFLAAQTAFGEIAGERRLMESEKYRGLRARTYLLSKAAFLLPCVVAQAAWMGVYVHGICRLPGGLTWQMGVLALYSAAFASLCLAVSSFVRRATNARRICFALATLQLPLSGTVLAPPEWLGWIARPLAPLYWGTSAYLESMKGTRFYEVLQILSALSPAEICLGILAAEVVLGLGMAILGCRMARLGVAGCSQGT